MQERQWNTPQPVHALPGADGDPSLGATLPEAVSTYKAIYRLAMRHQIACSEQHVCWVSVVHLPGVVLADQRDIH